MTQIFFSVDVETTSTNPFDGELLTLGAVAVDSQNFKIIGDFYLPLRYKGDKVDPETMAWWKTVPSQEVFEEAWGENFIRFNHLDAASQLSDWVCSFSDEWSDRIFAANPVSFDFPWIQKLYAETGLTNPFHYRTLCMRSLYFGLTEDFGWGESRSATGEFNTPARPHHALDDAYAQALDLSRMLQIRSDRGKFNEHSSLKGAAEMYSDYAQMTLEGSWE